MALTMIWVVMEILHLFMVAGFADGGGFPAMFIFGDSALDPGNNNNLWTTAKANFFPNGIDFPGGPTGRFCNGFTMADYLAYLLGLPLIPAFNNETTKGVNILKGVNYASGGAGILSFAAPTLGDKFSMDRQVQNFQGTVEDLKGELVKIGVSDTTKFLAESLIFVSIANNDLFTYLGLSNTLRYALFNSMDGFIDLVIKTFSEQLEKLYEIGGRRFLVCGLGPIGCIPFQQAANYGLNGSACSDAPNQMATKYNEKLKPLLTQLKRDLPGSNFAYGEAYYFGLNIILNPSPYGFKNVKIACCGQEDQSGNVKAQCLPWVRLRCSNRSDFFFWDNYHPTSALNEIAAKQTLLPAALSLLS